MSFRGQYEALKVKCNTDVHFIFYRIVTCWISLLNSECHFSSLKHIEVLCSTCLKFSNGKVNLSYT
jgi:hypothetical protein